MVAPRRGSDGQKVHVVLLSIALIAGIGCADGVREHHQATVELFVQLLISAIADICRLQQQDLHFGRQEFTQSVGPGHNRDDGCRQNGGNLGLHLNIPFRPNRGVYGLAELAREGLRGTSPSVRLWWSAVVLALVPIDILDLIDDFLHRNFDRLWRYKPVLIVFHDGVDASIPAKQYS